MNKPKSIFKTAILCAMILTLTFSICSCFDSDNAPDSSDTSAKDTSSEYSCEEKGHVINEQTGVCDICGYVPYYSEGLSYKSTVNGYLVDGIGECKDKEIIIPYAYNGSPVIGIDQEAFIGNKKITKVVLPHTITKIMQGAFKNCTALTEVVMSKNLNTLQEAAFYECSALLEIELYDGIEVLDWEVFYKCSSLEKAILPESIKEIKTGAFFGCKSLKEVNIPLSLTKIERWTFRDCESLLKADIPPSVTLIESQAFLDCKSLVSVSMSDNVKEIETGVFRGCESLENIRISDNLTVINSELFAGCKKLRSINIPSKTIEIKSDAFSITAITELTLPSTLKVMASLYTCYELKDIYYPASEAAWDMIVKSSLPVGCTIHCSDATIAIID